MWLGIDFSGDSSQWGAGRKASNVWIAEVDESPRRPGLLLRSLRRVQELPGDGHPFARLLTLLGTGAFGAAAIDAPFSIPAPRLKGQSHDDLLGRITGIQDGRRPFPRGAALVSLVAPEAGPRGVKEYRRTERVWIDHGLNVRSTLWVEPRGGAPMTAAALTLLAGSKRPMWPWALPDRDGLLVEAFPAAQLKTWRLPFQGYNGDTAEALGARGDIIGGLSDRVSVSSEFASVVLGSADALDAVLCAVAATAVTGRALARGFDSDRLEEGWIAVAR